MPLSVPLLAVPHKSDNAMLFLTSYLYQLERQTKRERKLGFMVFVKRFGYYLSYLRSVLFIQIQFLMKQHGCCFI